MSSESSKMTPDLARELWRYDKETGKLYWNITLSNRAVKGKEAGSVDYTPGGCMLSVKHKGKRYSVASIIWMIVKGVIPSYIIDHKDGVFKNNRIDNLREATHTQNMQNRKISRNSSTGQKGVIKCRNKFHARITYNGNCISLGVFNTAEEAGEAYRKKATELFGEFARW